MTYIVRARSQNHRIIWACKGHSKILLFLCMHFYQLHFKICSSWWVPGLASTRVVQCSLPRPEHITSILCPPKQETRTEKPYSKWRTAMIRQFSFNHNIGIPKVAFSGFPKPAKLNLGDSGLHFWLPRSIYQITWGNQINKDIFITDNLGNYQTSLNTEVKKKTLWNNFNFHIFMPKKLSFFPDKPQNKFKIKHLITQLRWYSCSAEHSTSQSSSHLPNCWSTDIPVSLTFGEQQQKVHNAQRCSTIKCPSNPVQRYRAFHCICVTKQKVSGALHVPKWRLSELRELINGWWIITCSSWWGRIKISSNHSPCFSLQTSVRSFLLVYCFPLRWVHTQQPPGSVLLGERMTQGKCSITLDQPEPSWTCSLQKQCPGPTWKQARIHQEKPLYYLS